MNDFHPSDWLVAFIAVISFVPFPAKFLGFQRAIHGESVTIPGNYLVVYRFVKAISFAIAVYVSIMYGRHHLSFWSCVILLMVLARVCLGDPGGVKSVQSSKDNA